MTDAGSTVQFRRYRRVVGPFAGISMRRWIRLAAGNAREARR